MHHPHETTDTVRPRLRSDHTRMPDAVPREDLLHRTWKRFRLSHGARPVVAALVIGGTAIAIAAQFGAPQLAMGAMAGYVTYRMMRYGVDLKQALTETIELERAVEGA